MRGETIAVLTAGTTTDPYSGEDAEDWTTPTEREVTTIAPLEPDRVLTNLCRMRGTRWERWTPLPAAG